MNSHESHQVTYDTIWMNTLVLLENAVTRPVFDKWIQPARIVFCNEERLGCLNKIVHPQVKQWIKNKIEEERLKGECTLFVIEAALLIEDHYDEICDELWYIHTDEGIRRKRLKESRGYSDEKIAGIMANQLSPEKFRKACQAVIVNNGLLEDTYQQIDKQLG